MKRWFLFIIAALLSVAVSAEDELKVLVYLNNGQCDSYLRSNVKTISYESTEDNPSEISIMRLCVIMTEDEEEKDVLIDYPLADIERVDFKPPYAWVATRANVHRKYTQTELRGEIGGNWKDWPGVQLGFFISKDLRPLTADDRRTVYADEICDGPGQFTYLAKNSEGYVGAVFYHYQAFALYKGEFFLVGEPESFRLDPVIMWTDTYAKLKKEDDEGHYYVAHVSADIFGDTKEISFEIEKNRAQVGFCYGPNELPTRANGATLVPGWISEVGDIECDVPHLEANKKVWVRPYTIIADTIYYGLDFSIMTEPWVKVTTDKAHDVEITSAKVNFHIEASAEEAFQGKVGIQFSTTPDLDALGEETYHDLYDWMVDGQSDFTGYFANLTPNTTYYCRAYLMANGKRYPGNIIEFTTKNISLKTYEAEDVTSTTAYIQGEVLDTDVIVEGNYFGFFYNTTGNPGSNNDDPYVYGTFGSDLNSKFFWPAKDLKPNTTYYVASFITYKGKIYLGNTITFTTAEEDYMGELGLFELKGHVKSCEWTNAWGTNTRTFDQNGFWLTGNGWSLNSIYPNGIKRDSEGRIIEGYYDEGGYESWTIDSKGRKMTWTDVLWDGGETHTYYYNENDFVYKETVEYLGMDVEWNKGYTVYYSDWELDSHGNWVKRTAQNTIYGYSQESRKIVYY